MRIFITGASSGLGLAMAKAWARREPSVCLGLVARRGQALAELAAALPHSRCHCFEADVLVEGELGRVASSFIASEGPPDVVIANAGISAGTDTGLAGDAAVFRRIIATNLTAMHDTFAAFLPAMAGVGRGTLVGIASMAGIRGMPGSGAYSASKAGAIAYLESLRIELARTPLRVVTIAPGFIRTPMTARNPFPMPFLMDADRFAEAAVASIVRGDSWRVIPWQMGLVAQALRLAPNALLDRALQRARRKPREPA